MKTCSKCKTEKPLSAFYKDASKRSGLRTSCKECARIATSDWNTVNVDKRKAYKAAWQKANPEKVKAYRYKWYSCSANRETHKETKAAWYEKNPNADRIHCHNRRARKSDSGGSLSIGLAEKLFNLQRGKCACGCGQSLGNDYQLDHIMPLALGGTNTDENIQLLRSTCNQQKHAKHPIDFMQQRGFLL